MRAETIRLDGDEATTLGEIKTASLGGRAGLALSRGRFPKVTGWVDANEDAVLAAHHRERWLLAAADGHFGFDAARAALTGVSAAAHDGLADDRDGRLVVRALLAQARVAVAEALSRAGEGRRRSRTALSVVLVRPGEAFAATCGDSSVFLVRRRRVRTVTSATPFLGPDSPPPPVVRLRLGAGDAMAAVTDGFTDFLGRAARPTLSRELAGGGPAQAARGLVTAAFAGGAGDNVGVAVLLPVVAAAPARQSGNLSARPRQRTPTAPGSR